MSSFMVGSNWIFSQRISHQQLTRVKHSTTLEVAVRMPLWDRIKDRFCNHSKQKALTALFYLTHCDDAINEIQAKELQSGPTEALDRQKLMTYMIAVSSYEQLKSLLPADHAATCPSSTKLKWPQTVGIAHTLAIILDEQTEVLFQFNFHVGRECFDQNSHAANYAVSQYLNHLASQSDNGRQWQGLLRPDPDFHLDHKNFTEMAQAFLGREQEFVASGRVGPLASLPSIFSPHDTNNGSGQVPVSDPTQPSTFVSPNVVPGNQGAVLLIPSIQDMPPTTRSIELPAPPPVHTTTSMTATAETSTMDATITSTTTVSQAAMDDPVAWASFSQQQLQSIMEVGTGSVTSDVQSRARDGAKNWSVLFEGAARSLAPTWKKIASEFASPNVETFPPNEIGVVLDDSSVQLPAAIDDNPFSPFSAATDGDEINPFALPADGHESISQRNSGHEKTERISSAAIERMKVATKFTQMDIEAYQAQLSFGVIPEHEDENPFGLIASLEPAQVVNVGVASQSADPIARHLIERNRAPVSERDGMTTRLVARRRIPNQEIRQVQAEVSRAFFHPPERLARIKEVVPHIIDLTYSIDHQAGLGFREEPGKDWATTYSARSTNDPSAPVTRTEPTAPTLVVSMPGTGKSRPLGQLFEATTAMRAGRSTSAVSKLTKNFQELGLSVRQLSTEAASSAEAVAAKRVASKLASVATEATSKLRSKLVSKMPSSQVTSGRSTAWISATTDMRKFFVSTVRAKAPDQDQLDQGSETDQGAERGTTKGTTVSDTTSSAKDPLQAKKLDNGVS